MNLSDVPLQITSREHLGTERAMFAHIVMDYFDVFFQAEDGHFFSTTRALFLDSRVYPLHVLGKLGRPYLLLALRALSCVAHVSFPDMEVYARRVDHLVTITTFFLGPVDASDMP